MPNPIQQEFWGAHGTEQGRDERCLVGDFIDPLDSACHELMESNYETLSCGSEKGQQYLRACRGATLLNIHAKEQNIPDLPSFIPYGFSSGSGYILRKAELPWIAITLGKIINSKTLEVVADVRSHIGVGEDTKVLLLNYAPDNLIERIWDNRKTVLPALAQTNVDLMTAIDYSVFLDQPHLESVVNIKRSFVTYDLLQEYGAKVIPHAYWRGQKSLDHLAEWFNANPKANHLANYPGLRKLPHEWQRHLIDLRYLRSRLTREITLVISGPSNPTRVAELIRIWPNAVISNGVAAQKAMHHTLLAHHGKQKVSDLPLIANIEFYDQIISDNKAETPYPNTTIYKVDPNNTFTPTFNSQQIPKIWYPGTVSSLRYPLHSH